MTESPALARKCASFITGRSPNCKLIHYPIFPFISSACRATPGIVIMKVYVGKASDLKESLAGACGNRTHPSSFWPETPALKAGRDTRTRCAPNGNTH